MRALWPIQENGVNGVCGLIHDGATRILLTSPTGTGKSVMMMTLIRIFRERGWLAVVYSNRRLLTAQLVANLRAEGFKVGVRAAGHTDQRHLPIQVASLPTEQRRQDEYGGWEIHGTGQKCLVLVDEAHNQKGPKTLNILNKHVQAGHVVVGVTATPIDLGGLYDHLVIAGGTSEGRRCGALVPAAHFGPDEPDLAKLKRHREGEDYTEKEVRQVMQSSVIWGRVIEYYRLLNPAGKPAILFGPGVKESLYFAEQFTKAGIPAAHVDGEDVWVNGRMWQSSPNLVGEILEMSRNGQIKVICNRYVFREGIDCPWLEHGIFATVFGSLQSYIQSGGRLLRASPSTGKTQAVIQDHGGHWHRLGSLNCDWPWSIDSTTASVVGVRADRLRRKRETGEVEPFRCPQCTRILTVRVCPCGFEPRKRSRVVVQVDGTLKELMGDIYRPKAVAKGSGAIGKWVAMYWRSVRMKNKPRTFAQAFALFAAENNWQWPDRSWPLMPKRDIDVYNRVCDVPFKNLVDGGRYENTKVQDVAVDPEYESA